MHQKVPNSPSFAAPRRLLLRGRRGPCRAGGGLGSDPPQQRVTAIREEPIGEMDHHGNVGGGAPRAYHQHGSDAFTVTKSTWEDRRGGIRGDSVSDLIAAILRFLPLPFQNQWMLAFHSHNPLKARSKFFGTIGTYRQHPKSLYWHYEQFVRVE